jgi:hypothetical protein
MPSDYFQLFCSSLKETDLIGLSGDRVDVVHRLALQLHSAAVDAGLDSCSFLLNDDYAPTQFQINEVNDILIRHNQAYGMEPVTMRQLIVDAVKEETSSNG